MISDKQRSNTNLFLIKKINKKLQKRDKGEYKHLGMDEKNFICKQKLLKIIFLKLNAFE